MTNKEKLTEATMLALQGRLFESNNSKGIPTKLYYYTTILKAEEITGSKQLKSNQEGLICCTTLDNFMQFNDNLYVTRFIIDTSRLADINIFKRNEDDSNYVESEQEWCIDIGKNNYLDIDKYNIIREDSKAEPTNKVIDDTMKNKINDIKAKYNK